VCVFQSCSECSVPTLAQSLCTLCNKWLCYQCTDVHQHQRGPTTSQYTDLHQQQRASATQCPDPLQIGSNSLPPIGRGKILQRFKMLLPPFPGQNNRLSLGRCSLPLSLSLLPQSLFWLLCFPSGALFVC